MTKAAFDELEAARREVLKDAPWRLFLDEVKERSYDTANALYKSPELKKVFLDLIDQYYEAGRKDGAAEVRGGYD